MTVTVPHTRQQSTARRGYLRILVAGLIIAVIVFVFLVPYIWVLASSLKEQNAIFTDLSPLSWKAFIPTSPTLQNYIDLITQQGILPALLNSFTIAVIQVVGAFLVCTPAAYALTRLRFRGRGLIFGIILITFMVPIEGLLVPLYGIMGDLGMRDTLLAVALPFIANAFGLFLLRQHFEEVPRELDEAALIDGAGHWRIFLKIILPNVRPALVSMLLLTFLAAWNAFLWPLVILQSPSKQPVQVAIAQSVSPGNFPNWGITFAGAMSAAIPVIILFIFLQRYFVQGFASSGLK